MCHVCDMHNLFIDFYNCNIGVTQMSQTEFVTKIDSRGSVNIPKALQKAGYKTGIKVLVKLEIVKEQLPETRKPREQGER